MAKLKKAAMLAVLEGIESIQERELVKDWLLITYDLPVTEEGNKARGHFLQTAPRLGAMMHTRSVYFMPQTQLSELAALELSKIEHAKVFVWTSSMDDLKAKELTELYDSRIRDEITTIEERIKNARKHVAKEQWGMAGRMMPNTIEAFNTTLYTAIQRGSREIIDELTKLRQEIAALHGEIGAV